jgi:DNA-binding MarR family transcriptional regulator
VSGTARRAQSRIAPEIGRDCLAVRVRLLNRCITRLYDAALRPHGLTIAQLNLLTSIANTQPVRSGKLADALSMEVSTLSRNLRLMEREGWIEVLRAERGNGRVLTLTHAGAAKLHELEPAWRAAQQQARELLGDAATSSIKDRADELLGEGMKQL